MQRFASSFLALLTGFALLAGCSTDKNASTPSKDVEVFRDGARPTRAFKEITVLNDDGKIEEQPDIEAKMIKKAQKLRGDAIIFEKPEQSGLEAQPFGFGSFKYTYKYKGTVVAYQ